MITGRENKGENENLALKRFELRVGFFFFFFLGGKVWFEFGFIVIRLNEIQWVFN